MSSLREFIGMAIGEDEITEGLHNWRINFLEPRYGLFCMMACDYG
jgi:hypothetical protein